MFGESLQRQEVFTEGQDEVPEGNEQEVAFSPEQTEDAERILKSNRRILALEVASNVKHLFNSTEEFWAFVKEIEDYLS